MRLVRWLPCIFTSAEMDILCILAFLQMMSFYPRKHIGARGGSGSSQCLAQGVWRISILAGRMKQTCFEKVEHEETKSLLCK